MATVQKFKLLAMQCGASQSTTLSPRTSPLVQIRRRRTTLMMLLCRSHPKRRRPEKKEGLLESPAKKGVDLVRRRSLKDLFGSSPPCNVVSSSKIGEDQRHHRHHYQPAELRGSTNKSNHWPPPRKVQSRTDDGTSSHLKDRVAYIVHEGAVKLIF